MDTQTEIPNEIKIALIQNEIALHKNTSYQLQLRHRVNKKLGGSAEELKALQDEMVKHEQAIEILNEELKELDE